MTIKAIGLLAAVLAAPLTAQEAAPAVKAGGGGFAIESADGSWTLRMRGLLQIDGRAFARDSATPGGNEWLLRRVRPTFEGKLGEHVGFRLMPDFGGGRTEVPDAYVDVELGDGGPVLRAGKFKPPVGLERLRSASDLQLIERSIVTELVPRRDVGVQLSGGGERLGWAAGLFNGAVDGSAADDDFDGKQDVAVRVFSRPFAGDFGPAGLGFGLAATFGSMAGTPSTPLLPNYRSPGQRTVFGYRIGAEGTFASGERRRVSPQLHWYRGPFGLMVEAARVSQDVRRSAAGFERAATLAHTAWQLTGNWLITGEAAGDRDPGGSGAVELVFRASGFTADEDSFSGGAASFADAATAARRADTRAIGINWRPQAAIKASLSYQQTRFAGAAASGNREDERVLLARLQVQY